MGAPDMARLNDMGGPEMAPHTPPSANRSSRGLDRTGGQSVSAGDGASEDSRAPASGSAAVVVTQIHGRVREDELLGHQRDTLVLTAAERRWGRRRVTTSGGRVLALALPTGSLLVPGQILHVGPNWYVMVEAAPEPVLAVTPRSREEALRLAFEVGNRHFSFALDGDRLLVPDDPAMERLLSRADAPFTRERAVFVPVGLGHRHEP